MQASQTQRSVSSKTLRAPPRWLGLLLIITAFLAACGGGSESPDTTAPPADPGPGAASFKLLPARLGLAIGGASTLLALQPPGALTWSSSDAAVASVDAQGQVTALAEGSAVITATSGNALTSSTVKVYAASAPNSTALIATALAQNQINAEQGLTYRVFALFGDDRLPAAYDGPPTDAPDHMLLRKLSASIGTLSHATQDTLLPFLLPPIYDKSWFAARLGVSPARALARPAAAKEGRLDLSMNCEVVASEVVWQRLSTAHFNIFYLKVGSEDARLKAETVASVAEEVYKAETDLFHRFPLSDAKEACNGGDGAVDIYLADIFSNRDLGGITTSYPGRCNNVPSYIMLNAQSAYMTQFDYGSGATPDEARRSVKAVVAHEFLHVLQLAMDRKGVGCSDYEWLDEATAEWAIDFVDPTFNIEDGIYKASSSYRRSGSFYAQYLYSDHMASIEQPGLVGEPMRNGYADYIFFQYLARKYDPQTIKQIFDATEAQASVEAVQTALASKGGMKAVWPEFALTLWNDAFYKVLDDFGRWDNYDFGLAQTFDRRQPVPFLFPEAERLKTIAVDQKGKPREKFKLLKNALELPGEFPADNYEIQPRSLFYEHLKFSDPTVHSVYFSNPIAIIPSHEFMKVQAKKKIAGQWKEVEDWTQDAYKQFCLDKQDERLEELLIVVSNSEVNRGTEAPFRIPKTFPMLISTSNVGCWKWQGTASVVKSGGMPQPVDVTARGNVTLEMASVLPGRIIFQTSDGIVNGRQSGMVGQCLVTLVGADKTVQKGGTDGTIDFNLDLDLGFTDLGGPPPDRKLITLSGLSALSTTTTMECPAPTQTTVGNASWDWLRVDDASLYQVSADGQTIEGRFTGLSATGATITTVWKFTALRE